MAQSIRDDQAIVEAIDDYSRRRVPESATRSGWDIALVRMGFTVSASDLLFGYTIGLYFGFWDAIAIALAYSAIVSVVSILMGLIGLRERTSFGLCTRFTFGREGSRIPSLVIAVIIAGFYGYVLGITVDVLPGLTDVTKVVYSLALGIIFLGIAGIGFEHGLRWAGRIGVPLMIALVIVADVATIVHVGGFGKIVHATPKMSGAMGVSAVIALGTAKWLGGAVVTPDLLRFARGPRAVVGTTLAEFVVGNAGFNLLGLILGLGLGASDLGTAFSIVGISALATVAFVIQGITVEANELYAASLAVSNALGLKRWMTAALVGLVGMGLGYYGLTQGIIDSFLTFIGDVGYALPAIPSIMIADYFIVRRMSYPEGLEGLPAVNWRAIIAFAATVALNVVLGVYLDDDFWHSMPIFGGLIYLALSVPQLLAPRVDAEPAPPPESPLV